MTKIYLNKKENIMAEAISEPCASPETPNGVLINVYANVKTIGEGTLVVSVEYRDSVTAKTEIIGTLDLSVNDSFSTTLFVCDTDTVVLNAIRNDDDNFGEASYDLMVVTL